MTQTGETIVSIQCPDCHEPLSATIRQTATDLPEGGSVIELHDTQVEHHCPVTGNQALLIQSQTPLSYCP